MDTRMELAQFSRIAEGVSTALRAISKAVADSGLEPGLIELIKIRASQWNGCAFCTQFHLNVARKHNVPDTKLDLVAVWRDAGIFSTREKIALEWTEALTAITPDGISDELYADTIQEFGVAELAFLTSAIANINAWNRIATAYQFTPPIPQDHAVE
ncbi:MAG: carboxymuconolactone decarboxylase family protein [Edaphobacter sp.]